MSEPRRYLIEGGFGYGSLGDDIFGRQNCTVASNDPDETTRMHEVKAISMHEIESFDDYDHLIIGGGGIMMLGWTREHLKLAITAKTKGKGVEVFRVGIYGDNSITDYDALKQLYQISDKFTVRSLKSQERMKQYCGVDVNIEPCCAEMCKKSAKPVIDGIFNSHGIDRDGKKRLVGIHCKNVPEVIQFYTAIISDLHNNNVHDIEYIGISTCSHKINISNSDLLALQAINSSLSLPPCCHIKTLQGPWHGGTLGPNEMKGVLAELDLLLANRKHPALCAAAEGVPVVAIDNDTAVSEMAYTQEIKNIGVFEVSKSKPNDVSRLILRNGEG
jgi:preprotein translocase subunit SecB